MRIADRIARLEAKNPQPVRHWDFSRTPVADLEFVSEAGRQYRDMAAMPADVASRFARILAETDYAAL